MAVCAALSALHLPFPLYTDQAAFVLIARELADGVRYFGEIWDMKQPGIYWWYELTGYLFGFNAFGVRLMDLCWSIFVSLMLWLILRNRGSLVAILGPVFAFGAFYAAAISWTLSQVEWLVCAPLVLLLWCLYTDQDSRSFKDTVARYCLGGAMLGAVALLKTMLIPVAGVMILVALGHDRWVETKSWPSVVKLAILPIAVGFSLVLAPILIHMAWNGTLATAVWTTFVYPAHAVREYQAHPVAMLMSSLRWFLKREWILTLLALWAMSVGIRQGSRLVVLLTAWITVAFISITAQVLSFWFYHFDVFFIPVGLLAAVGFAEVMDRLKYAPHPQLYRTTVAVVLALCAAGMMLPPLARKVQLIATTHAFPSDKQRSLELSMQDSGLQDLIDSANAVRPLTTESDRIVVWGDPRMYLVIGRRPLDEVDGGTIYLTSQLQDVAKVIRKKRPILFFMSKFRDSELTNHGGGIIPRVLDENYLPYYENNAGVWYRIRPDETS